MMMWNMLVQFMGVGDQAAMKETVESLNSLGYPELIIQPENEPAMRVKTQHGRVLPKVHH